MEQRDAKERLAAIQLNHSPIVSSHPCSEASCEQAFLLHQLGEARMVIIAELRAHAAYCDTWSGNPKQLMDESDWCRAAANFLDKNSPETSVTTPQAERVPPRSAMEMNREASRKWTEMEAARAGVAAIQNGSDKRPVLDLLAAARRRAVACWQNDATQSFDIDGWYDRELAIAMEAALAAAAQAARTQALNEALLEVEKRVGLGANKHTLTRAIRSLSTKRDGT